LLLARIVARTLVLGRWRWCNGALFRGDHHGGYVDAGAALVAVAFSFELATGAADVNTVFANDTRDDSTALKNAYVADAATFHELYSSAVERLAEDLSHACTLELRRETLTAAAASARPAAIPKARFEPFSGKARNRMATLAAPSV
jgi:hypothetical protein